MISIFLHLLLLGYGTVHWRGYYADFPVLAIVLWSFISLIVLLRTLPDYVDNSLEKGRVPSFLRVQEVWQWSLVLWILALHALADPVGNIAPELLNKAGQFLPMAFSALMYVACAWPLLFEIYRLFKPILDERQTPGQFFRARMTIPILFFPPMLFWMLIEDLTAVSSGLQELQDLKLLIAAPVFFVFLYLLAPRLFNWAWHAEPMQDEELRQKITDLSKEAETPISGVKIWDTFNEPVPNAAVAGLSKRYRFVYITRYLLELFNKEQVTGVIAHELAHLRLGHVLNYMVYSLDLVFLSIALKLMVIVYVPEWAQASALQEAVEMIAFLGIFAVTFTALARESEYQADAFAAEMAGKQVFAGGLERLEKNIMPPPKSIPGWLLTHPQLQDRIKRVKSWNGSAADLLKRSRKIRLGLLALGLVFILAAMPAAGPVLQVTRLAAYVESGNIEEGQRMLSSLPEWLGAHPLVEREAGKLAMMSGKWHIAVLRAAKAVWNLNFVLKSEKLHHAVAPEIAFDFKFVQFMLQTLDLG